MHWPVVTSVSQATRAWRSWVRMAARIASEVWSAHLSGWPIVTDSLVNRCELRRKFEDTAGSSLGDFGLEQALRTTSQTLSVVRIASKADTGAHRASPIDLCPALTIFTARGQLYASD